MNYNQMDEIMPESLPQSPRTETLPRELATRTTPNGRFRLVQTDETTLVLERLSYDAMGSPTWIGQDSATHDQMKSRLLEWLFDLAIHGVQK